MNFKVIGIGEVLWDLLPSGPKMGGAPANFACHCRQLGADAQILTRVGNDPFGWKILQQFSQLGINFRSVQLDEALPTGTAGVLLDSAGSPQFTVTENVAWDALVADDLALAAMRGADAICFGTLAQRTPAAAAAVRQLLSAATRSSWRVFDLNLRQNFFSRGIIESSLAFSNAIKLNEDELEIISPMFSLTGRTAKKIEVLAQRYGLQLVALTRGARGSLLYQPGAWSELAGSTTTIVDTVGAGDAFTAGLVMGLLNRLGLESIHRIAADLASYVCSRPGATPTLPVSLRAALEPIASVSGGKVEDDVADYRSTSD